MVLNERKMKILEAIINDYIQSAEPIGSRTIAKKYDFGVSSATIRNEMSDLEEMGFIIQPHTSAGRVPSDKGYRLYVDRLMQHRELTAEESDYLQGIITNNINQIDYLMKETAKAIALLTNYTTIVSEPKAVKTRFKHMQLAPVDDKTVLLILITDSKVVKNRILKVDSAPDYEQLHTLTGVLNDSLTGFFLERISQELIDMLSLQFGGYADVLMAVLSAIADEIQYESEKHIYTSGVKNILGYPEFSDLEKAKSFFQTLEEQDTLITMLGEHNAGHIQIVIGAENSLVQMKDCSIIKANYMIGQENYGSIGVIGPTRMDYVQAVSVLNGIVRNINVVIKALSGG